MKKGFTLIELLAVIVILAIIALIATPIVLSIIKDTKNSALLRSAEHYLDAVELGSAKKNLTSGGNFSPSVCEIQSDGNLLCDETETLEVEVSGETPAGGTITFNNGKITSVYKLTLGGKKLTTNQNGKLEIKDYITYTVTYTNIDNTSELPTIIEESNTLEVDLTGREIDSNKIQVKINNEEINDYTYEENKLIINNVSGNVEVIRTLDTYTVIYENIEDETDLPTTVMEGNTLTVNLTNKGILEEEIIVKINNEEINDYTYENYILTVEEVTGNVIVIGVEEKSTLANYIKNLYEETKTTIVNGIEYSLDETHQLMNDRLGNSEVAKTSGNIRYYGANPNNYIDIGDRDSDNNIIFWRIIGVFKDIEVTDEDENVIKTEDLVKIIRADSLSSGDVNTFSWDFTASAQYDNNWHDSTLQIMLNDEVNGYFGSGTINYFNNSQIYTKLNFSSTGLSSEVHNKIERVNWNLGGHDTAPKYVDEMYGYERTGTNKWSGKIALIYPSDYGYSADLGSCQQILVEYQECRSINWIYDSAGSQWTITPYFSNPKYVYRISNSYINYGNYVNYPSLVHPVVYLNSDVGIVEEKETEEGLKYFVVE